MKKLISMMASYMLCACGSTMIDNMYVSPELKEHVEQFFFDCSLTKYRYYCDIVRENIKSIKIKDLEGDVVGRFAYKRTLVRDSNKFIDKMSPKSRVVAWVKIDPNTPDIRLTVYHELGHSIGIAHDDKSCIMSTYIRWEKVNAEPMLWKECVDELFATERRNVHPK